MEEKINDYGFFNIINKDDYGWIINSNPGVVICPIKYDSSSSNFENDQTVNKIGLIEIFREPIGKINWELPGGAVNNNETPKQTAIRELEEETNTRSKKLIKIGNFFEAPGRMIYEHHVFIAIDPVNLLTDNNNLQINENIHRFKYFNIDDINQMVLTGRIISGPTISALHLLFLLNIK